MPWETEPHPGDAHPGDSGEGVRVWFCARPTDAAGEAPADGEQGAGCPHAAAPPRHCRPARAQRPAAAGVLSSEGSTFVTAPVQGAWVMLGVSESL